MKQKRNKWDPKAKQRKQRRLVIILGIVFAAIAAWQGPKTWKSLHAKPPVDAAAPAPTTPSTGGPVATAAPGGALAAAPAAVPPATDPIPVAGEGQLVGFSLFKSKDPFVSQLEEPASTDPSVSSDPPASAPPASNPPAIDPPASEPPASEPPASEPPAIDPPAAEPPAIDPPAAEPPAIEPPATEPPATVPPSDPPVVDPPAPSPPAPPAPLAPPAPPAKPTSATISVNGVKEEITIGAVFPKDEQLFRLVSIEDDVAQIAIAGGTYQDGAPTVPLTLGKPLTLMNTADGTRYVLRLLAVA